MILSFFSKTKIGPKPILGILLKESEGVLILIKEQTIIDQVRFPYSNSWENLIEDIDETLYQLENKHNIHLEQVIFFLYSHFIDINGNIKSPYQQKIKSIIKKLELKPLGYIECHEAITKFYETKGENNLTAILVEIDINNISLFIYKAGQVNFTKTIARTDNFIDDLLNCLNQVVNKFILPTKIVLYNSKNLDKAVTEIVNYHWPTNIFLQLPKVEIINENDLLKSLVDLFNNQLKTITINQSKPNEIEGFLIGDDIKNKPIIKDEVKKEKKSLPFNLPAFLKNISLPNLMNFFQNYRWNKSVLTIIGILTIFFAFFINEYFFHKLFLKIYLPTKSIKKNVTLSYGKTDGDLIIESIKKKFPVSVEKQSTGEKEIGSPAQGQVTIYNFSKEIAFPKGTILIAQQQEFTLDDEVRVASASLTTDSSAKLPGKKDANVTAKEIGPQGNLAENQTFILKNYDSETYFAKNQSSFSGGSKKKITTVSQKDLNNLEKIAIDKVKKQTLKENLIPNKKIIHQLTEYTLNKKNFSKEVGEEAEMVSLNSEVEITIFTYNNQDLINLVIAKIKKDIPVDFEVNAKKIFYKINKVDKKNNILDISIDGVAIKTIDKKKLEKRLLGKNNYQLSSILKNEFNVSGYEEKHQQWFKIPIYKDFLPFFSKNIIIKDNL